MRRVRSRLTILLLILVIVTSLLSLTIGALVRNGILFQRDNMRYLLFGYAAKDILLLLVAAVILAVRVYRRHCGKSDCCRGGCSCCAGNCEKKKK